MTAARLALAACLALVVSGCRGEESASVGGPHSQLSCGACHTGSSAGFATEPAPPEACLECHEPADLSDPVRLDGIEFAHLTHAEVAPGVPIPCGGCHNHEDGGERLQVSSGSCFLCHGAMAGGRALAAGDATEGGECQACHQALTHTARTSSSVPIPHAVVAERGISCLSCHYDVLNGSGSVSASRCGECHGRGVNYGGPGGMPADSIHAIHLTREDATACTRCHGSLSHEVVGLAAAIQLNCLNCHSEAHGLSRPAGGDAEWAQACIGCHEEAHRAEQELYTGLGGQGPGQLPAVMFRAHVSCASCHRGARGEPTSAPAERLAGINDGCVACHGTEYAFMLPLWKVALEEKVVQVGRYVERARDDRRLFENASADSALAGAAANLNLLIRGNGLHNVPAADALLRGALEDVARAYRQGGLQVPASPPLGPNPETVSCAHCHYGVEAVVDTVFGERFSHRPHVLDGGLACEGCHAPAPYFSQDTRRPDPQHGLTTVTREDCQSCHHVRTTSSCEACHDREEMTASAVSVSLALEIKPTGAPKSRQVIFEHGAHLALECSACHAPGRSPTAPAACSECHEPHHGGSASCAGCHGNEMQTVHSVENHFDCTRCHDSSTLELLSVSREFCLACHPSRIDHEVGRECTPCHMQSSPAEVKARILER